MNQHQQQIQARPKISWPDLYFYAEVSHEPFRDATIVRAKYAEYVKITEGKIEIAIFAKVIDDDALFKALDYLAQTLEQDGSWNVYRIFS